MLRKVEPGRAYYETLEGEERELNFDMAMLLPPFSGVGLKAYDRKANDITPSLFAPNGFMRVDAVYDSKPYESWEAGDWPRYYQSPGLLQLVRSGHCLRATTSHLASSVQPERDADISDAAANGNALGDDRQGRSAKHCGYDAR